MIGGYDSTMKILDRAPGVTALVACNDANALAGMGALRTRGLEVPRDISVVGFDDIPAAQEAWPPLTTMRVDARQMGRLAMRMLQARVADPSAAPTATTLQPQLVRRASA